MKSATFFKKVLFFNLGLILSVSIWAQKEILPKKDNSSSVQMTQPIKRVISQNESENSKELLKINTIDASLLTSKSSHQEKVLPLRKKINKISHILIDSEKYNKKSLGGIELSYQFLEDVSEQIQIENPRKDFRHVSSEEENERVHLRFQQHYQGVKIHGGELIIHQNEKGLYLMNGTYFPTKNLDLDINPSLSLEQVKKTVMKFSNHHHFHLEQHSQEILGMKVETWKSELSVFYDENLDQFHLAYMIQMMPNMGHNHSYIVDAHSGEILREFTNICRLHNHLPADGPSVGVGNDLSGTRRTLQTYTVGNTQYLIDASKAMYNPSSSSMPNDPQGVIWTIDAFNTAPQNDNFTYGHVTSGGDFSQHPAAVSAHYNAEIAYNYFKNTHQRESVNGNGGNVVSFVNVADENGQSMGNAFWNGLAIFYGNGDAAFEPLGKALDVAGHELAHGVIQNTANLEYYGESGALNESFADIFGAMMDREDWLIGEEVVRSSHFPSGALRNMMDPHNDASQGDFSSGWQPKHVNEQFRGSEDNGGVHINSGIPNHAYYLFATAVGKDRAEKVYYAALNNYMTRSSKFIDQRIAVVQAAMDLYGSTVSSAAEDAFSSVGIGEGPGNNYEEDVDTNPGNDFILITDPNRSKLILVDDELNVIANPLSTVALLSKPSITDDGSNIVFVGQDNKMHHIGIDWIESTVQSSILQQDPIWRNVAISRDGSRLAALTTDFDNSLYVYDFRTNTEQWFELENPTYTTGVSTGDVRYADVIEFDFSGNSIIYDAVNQINSTTSGNIEYWDIGIIQVWNPSIDSWSLGQVSKVFSALPEGISVGNPTFSKNSPYIIALDYLEGDENQILGVNLESGTIGLIYENTGVGYPNYSRKDDQIIFDAPYSQGIDIGTIDLNTDKITAQARTAKLFLQDHQWAVWFSNGSRDTTTDLEYTQPNLSSFSINPNPTTDYLELVFDSVTGENGKCELFDLQGRLLRTKYIGSSKSNLIMNIRELETGLYIVKLQLNGSSASKIVVKK